MNTKEAAKKWELSQRVVRDRCKSGLIPFAEKRGTRWDIPDDAIKPIITPHFAYELLQYIEVVTEGGVPSLPQNAEEAMTFLSNIGFCTQFQKDGKLLNAIRKVSITSLGRKFINNLYPQETIKEGIKVGISQHLGYYREKQIKGQ